MIQNITSKNYVCCSFCNSKFYYDEDDLIDVDEKHYGFICPECGNRIKIKERKICSFPDSFFKFDTHLKLQVNGKNVYCVAIGCDWLA